MAHNSENTQRLKSLPVELEAIYTTPGVDQPVTLYKGKMELKQTRFKLAGSGQVEWNWLPGPHVRFELGMESKNGVRTFPMMADLIQGKGGESWSLHIPGVNGPIEPLITNVHFPLLVSGLLSNGVELGGGRLSSVLFHVNNFHDYIGSAVRDNDLKRFRNARVILEAEEWRVIVETVPYFDHDFKQKLDRIGGSAITHVGKLERLDGRTLETKKAKALLAILYYYLSFCRGIWVAPILPVGYDAKGSRVWEEWSNWKIERSQHVDSWFNNYASDGLEGTFSGFLRRWRDEKWQEPIRIVLHWYIESNGRAGGMEGAIILTQVAFELIGWALFRDVLSEDGFEKLPAADKLRLILSTLEIPSSIHADLKDLLVLSKQKENNWRDGPQAFVEIRNAFVHSSPRKRQKVSKATPLAIYEAWQLGLWYLELILLRLFDYRGTYSNRLKRVGWKGQDVEQVPWAPK